MSEIVNYAEFRSALKLVLSREAPEKQQKILESLDDAVANNGENLVLTSDLIED